MLHSNRNHEITTAKALLNSSGHLNEPGWARSLILKYDRNSIKASSLRIKEWDYYLILNENFGAAFTISDNGYIGLQSASFLDFEVPFECTKTVLNPIPLGQMNMPSTSEAGTTSFSNKQLKLRFNVENNVRHIQCKFNNFYNNTPFICNIYLTKPPKESLVIATPFNHNKTAFYYNQKINCLHASGYMIFNNKKYSFSPKSDFGTLDWGRGVWTYDNKWYWSSGNGIISGKPFGFNLGYGFGNTSSATENVIIYDGICHKLNDVKFHIPNDSYTKPWYFASSDKRFEATFKPIIDRNAKVSALIISTDQHQVFGKMNGRVILDDGSKIILKDFLCFAEHVHNRY